jgi:hypothetical protein
LPALERSWYQKWFVLRLHRPESGGRIVHLIKTGQGNTIDGSLDKNVLDSEAVEKAKRTNEIDFLSRLCEQGVAGSIPVTSTISRVAICR